MLRPENRSAYFQDAPPKLFPNQICEAELQVKKLGAALARQSGREEAECVRHLFQRLSILLVKGNAALFLNRQPHHPEPEIDGVE